MEKSTKPIIKYFTDYLNYLEIEQGLSPKSVENYERFLKKLAVWLIKNKLIDLKPHELSAEHIYSYKTFLARQGASLKSPAPLKKSTQNYYLIALRNLLKYFAAKDIISLPADKVTLLRAKEDKQIKFLKLEQVEQLLLTPDTSTLSGSRDRAILETLFSTGLRVAELVALDRDQLKIRLGTD